MDRQDDLDRVGLIAFTAAAEEYPAPSYLRNLVTRYENLKEGDVGLLGKLAYRIRVDSGNATRDLIATSNASEPQRLRRFETSDNLFPNLAFGGAETIQRFLSERIRPVEHAAWTGAAAVS